MNTYDAITKTGLLIHLSMSESNTGYILVHDLVDLKLTIKFFTDVESALSFIHSLWVQKTTLWFYTVHLVIYHRIGQLPRGVLMQYTRMMNLCYEKNQ